MNPPLKLLAATARMATVLSMLSLAVPAHAADQIPVRARAADAELNRVYGQVRELCNEQQKQQLKQLQLAWLKKRTELYRSATGDRDGLFEQVTLQRVEELRSILQSAGSNRQAVPPRTPPPDDTQYGSHSNEIISDAELQRVEADLNRAYQELMARLDENERIRARDLQRAWLKEREQVLATQRNQRFAFRYLTEVRSRLLREWGVQSPDGSEEARARRDNAAYEEWTAVYRAWLNAGLAPEKQKYLARSPEITEIIMNYDGGHKGLRDSLKALAGQTPRSHSAAGQLSAALQRPHPGSGICVVGIPREKVVVSALGSVVKIWDAKSGRLLRDVVMEGVVDALFPVDGRAAVLVVGFEWKYAHGFTVELNLEDGSIKFAGENSVLGAQMRALSRVGFCRGNLWCVGTRTLPENLQYLRDSDMVEFESLRTQDQFEVQGSELRREMPSRRFRLEDITGLYPAGNSRYLLHAGETYLMVNSKFTAQVSRCSEKEALAVLEKFPPASEYVYDLDADGPRMTVPALGGGSGSLKVTKKPEEARWRGKDGSILMATSGGDVNPEPVQVSLSKDGARLLVSTGKKLLGLDLKQLRREWVLDAPVRHSFVNPKVSSSGANVAYTAVTAKDPQGGQEFAPEVRRMSGSSEELFGTTRVSGWDQPDLPRMEWKHTQIQGEKLDGSAHLLAVVGQGVSVCDLNNHAVVSSWGSHDLARRAVSVGGDKDLIETSLAGRFFYPRPNGCIRMITSSEAFDFARNTAERAPLTFTDEAKEALSSIFNLCYDEPSNGQGVLSGVCVDASSVVLFGGSAGATRTSDVDPSDYMPECAHSGATFVRWIDETHFLVANAEGVLVRDRQGRDLVVWVNRNAPGSGRIAGINRWAYASEAKMLAFASPEGAVRLFWMNPDYTWENRVTVYFEADGEPIFVSEQGYYASRNQRPSAVAFTVGRKSFPMEQFYLRMNRPDVLLGLVGGPAEAARELRQKNLRRMGVTEEMLQPDFHVPELEIVGDVPVSTKEGSVSIRVRASDTKYPLERLRVFVNNVPVNGRDGELLREAKSQTLERTIPVRLAAGRNKIQISVLNGAGAESLYANAEVICTQSRPKPVLYAVAMGVSEYGAADWNLRYAAKDARDLVDRLRTRAGKGYREVKTLLLTDREVTREKTGAIREFLRGATVDDTVVLFVAGHGLLDEKYDYYFGTSDVDFSKPAGRGLAFEEFDDILAEIPCLRKSLLMDTCHAGELDEEEKQFLASGQKSPVVAMLPAGARGMKTVAVEGARGRSEWYDRLQGLFLDLRRGSGATVLSSSAGAEYALESSQQKNGLFTYAVLEALDGRPGADVNRDGSVRVAELAGYVKSRVSELSRGKQTPNLRRVNLEGDFVLSVR